MTHKLIKTTDYILVVDDSEIQKGDCYLSPSGIWFYNHLNPNHNKESKKVCAHLPLNGSPILEGVDLLPPIEDNVEELAEINYPVIMSPNGRTLAGGIYNIDLNYSERSAYKKGYNKAREKYKYTEEDIRKALLIKHDGLDADYVIEVISNKYATEFECEMEDYCGSPLTTERCPKCIDSCDRAYQRPKTITTAQGIQWVGKYN
jgi:hypothetical protein